MHLSDEHMRLLEESGITPEVIEARGYRTVEKKVELKSLGFSEAQRNIPGLLIPIYGPDGEKVLYQYRPDEPRIKGGRPVKYETPPGSRMVFDSHPFARERLADPAVPLFATEGLRKSDALLSRGLCAIGLLGVWSWRGTNERGGRVALPEFEAVALRERQVYAVFDSDIMVKRGVYEAMRRLKAFLESRGADVAAIYLTSCDGGAKQGVDDYLAAGHSVDDLLGLATTALREPPEGAEVAEEPDTQAAELVRYADDAYLFHTPDGDAYATFPLEGKR